MVSRYLKVGVFALLASLSAIPAAQAQEEPLDDGYRWFEVEVLVFKYNDQNPSIQEQYPLEIRPIRVNRARSLIGAKLRPQLDGLLHALPRCSWMTDLPAGVGDLNWPIESYSIEPLPDFTSDIFCKLHEERIVTDNLYPAPAERIGMEVYNPTPVVVAGEGGDVFTTQIPFLMPQDNLRFTELRNDLVRRNAATPILHSSWRQPVFGRTTSRPHRLFGGLNFTQDFDYLGFAKPEEETDWLFIDELENGIQEASEPLTPIEELITAIERGEFRFVGPAQNIRRLPEQPDTMPQNLPQDVWEFDGLMQIYLVGNYLHIDGEFNFREPASFSQQFSSAQEQAEAFLEGEIESIDFLRSYYLNQVKRVISHEIHYFDHPKFGVVVEIRRTERSAQN
ncbi:MULTISPECIES: CsiV family protein [Gammaproteobacteria]|uniref:CsiV family protein n=1 Tax=Gammaproteobacteria TaxID=1236 RepID=UPI00140334ED|nr:MULTISPECIES: CsiV family protein [Gammaproteobacteria]